MFSSTQKLKRFFLHTFFFIKKYFYLLLILGLIYSASIFAERGVSLLNKLEIKPVDLLGFFGSSNETLSNQSGITNFLFLGIRGEGVDSPNLTDSIVFLSYNQSTKQVSQMGIPRDLWVPSLQDRINTAYHYGEEASPGAGIRLAEASIMETTGQPINYTIVINFNLFKQIIDLIGGVDINVSPGFEDNEYPLPGMERALPISSRYETVVFPEGQNHLNGEMALKFVRSRHSDGDEGTDFARSRRQQQIINALKDKLFSKDFLLSKEKIDELIGLTQTNLHTNLPSSLYPVLARLGLDQAGKNINTINLSTTPDSNGVSILMNPPVEKYKGKWILLPKDNNWKALKQYIEIQLQK